MKRATPSPDFKQLQMRFASPHLSHRTHVMHGEGVLHNSEVTVGTGAGPGPSLALQK